MANAAGHFDWIGIRCNAPNQPVTAGAKIPPPQMMIRLYYQRSNEVRVAGSQLDIDAELVMGDRRADGKKGG